MLKSSSTTSQEWLNKSNEEKAAIHAANIAYNQRIASMSKREYLEDKIKRLEARLAQPANEYLARAIRVDIEVSIKELAKLK